MDDDDGTYFERLNHYIRRIIAFHSIVFGMCSSALLIASHLHTVLLQWVCACELLVSGEQSPAFFFFQFFFFCVQKCLSRGLSFVYGLTAHWSPFWNCLCDIRPHLCQCVCTLAECYDSLQATCRIPSARQTSDNIANDDDWSKRERKGSEIYIYENSISIYLVCVSLAGGECWERREEKNT